jgi:uncharacterized protein (TIGR02722 family)
MKKIISGLGGLFLLAVMIGGCATTRVERISPEKTVDLSGRWNDTDSRLVAEEMLKEALARPWVDNFVKKRGKEPTVIVGTVVNRSHEHINIETFTKDLERELTNSGRVQFVASKGEREEVREERLEQQTQSSEETAKGLGKEIGADYMLKGTINSIQDEEKGTKVVYYQVTLEMVDIETNVKVWFGDKKIKKIVEKSRLGF